jgi:hypothetical protein
VTSFSLFRPKSCGGYPKNDNLLVIWDAICLHMMSK